MHRQPLLKLLENYLEKAQPQGLELLNVQRVQRLVKAEPACFERTTIPGHITASAWILNHRQDQVLLTHHRKLDLWLQPGGHADGQSDVRAVALREAQEESGIEELKFLSEQLFDVDVHAIPARKNEPAHFHYDLRFALIAPEGAQYVVSEESHDLAWVPREKVAHYTADDSVHRMCAKWKPGA